MQRLNLIFLSLAVSLALSLPVSAASLRAYVEPSILDLGTDETTLVDVRVENVLNLYSWQFDLSYDPSLLAVEEQIEGEFLSRGGATFFLPGFDDGLGVLSFVAASLTGTDQFGLPSLDTSGVSGNGVLASVRFRSLAAATSTVAVSNVMLLDATGNVVLPEPIGNDEAIPEPATWILLAGAGLALGFWKRRSFQ